MSVSNSRWFNIDKLTGRRGPSTQSDTASADETKKHLVEQVRVLVIGAGGLGCELLKNLALSGFKKIDVIDMDTIDYSNLNRQFLFRKGDVGKSKAECAAAFINKRIPGVEVTPHFCKIQDKDDDFYAQFNIIIAGLDSIDARRWINALLVNRVEVDDNGDVADPDDVIPLIDGGTEGFKGQARVIIPRITSCFECSLDAFPPQTHYPICTIANTPRQPEHCIEWANIIQWPKEWPGVKFDADNVDHMRWMFVTAAKRADEFNIQGVTPRLTSGVVKNIIPAIASTNAIIAAAEAHEAFKVATYCGPSLDNYMMYNGVTGLYTYTFQYERKESCPVCGTTETTFEVSSSLLLEEFLVKLAEDSRYQLKKPSIRCNGKSVFMQQPPALLEATKHNLQKSMGELVADDSLLDVTDPSLPSVAVQIHIRYTS
eukprot:TRINITY_DN458_c0_g1_i2.p1 TRINITY_DN458_c0_g1~~TRINITY_DN458_c0_g1_i2.p1  ORF type:complete len:429 (+),score=2.77 TRINITY_DN458_c0_g1_i2:716-2002(+)